MIWKYKKKRKDAQVKISKIQIFQIQITERFVLF